MEVLELVPLIQEKATDYYSSYFFQKNFKKIEKSDLGALKKLCAFKPSGHIKKPFTAANQCIKNFKTRKETRRVLWHSKNIRLKKL